MLDINSQVTLSNDFEPSNPDEKEMHDHQVEGRIVDVSHNGDKYFVTFDDTIDPDEDDSDIGFWVDIDQVDLA